MKTFPRLLLAATMLSFTAVGQSAEIEKVQGEPVLQPLDTVCGGRANIKGVGMASNFEYQWPGLYFEAAFEGPAVYFKVGPADQALHLSIDGQAPLHLVKPLPGAYRVGGLSNAKHAVRIEVVNESQDAPMHFGGLAVAPDSRPLPAPTQPARQIEFIGDSHTVGYGNTSTKRECTPTQIWTTTDNSQAFGVLTAKHYRADYRIRAISGRGIVRNYNGFAAPTLPEAYPFVLFDRKLRADEPTWRPQIIVINLGTNDFSTPLNPGEKWKSREELHLDYEATYVQFIQDLRARNPKAFFLLLANDSAKGEIQVEVQKVLGQLKVAGENQIAFIPIQTMELTACDWHPSLKDHRMMAGEVSAFIDAHPQLWQGK